MAIPSTMSDLSTTASSNSPAGSENVGPNMDNYIRAVQAIIKNDVSKGSDISSANALTVPDNGHYFVVTGTTNVTSIGNTYNGRTIILKFSGILTLTDSASLILFGSNITTAAGDVLTITNESSGVYRAISFTKATDDGVTLAGTQTLTNTTIVAANNTVTTAASGDLAATELNAALAELAAERASLTGTQTLTNKTIVVANNTITTAASGGLVATELNDALAELEAEIVLKSDIASPTFTGTPSADTAATATDTTQLATTEFVHDVHDAGAADVATAWCVFDGTNSGTFAILDGEGVDDVTKNGTGDYTINLTATLSTVNFAVDAMTKIFTTYLDSTTTTTARIKTRNNANGAVDSSHVSVLIFGG